MHGTVPPHRPPRILLPRASHLHLNVRLPRVAYLPSPLPPLKRPNPRLPQVAWLEMAAIENALEAAGVEFTNGGQPGVRLRTAPADKVPELEVEPAVQTKLFWFVFKGGEDAPPGSHILVKGLPAGVSLSSGQADSDEGWVVPLSELEELEIKVPRNFSGKLNLDAQLVDGSGAVLDEHPVKLVVPRQQNLWVSGGSGNCPSH